MLDRFLIRFYSALILLVGLMALSEFLLLKHLQPRASGFGDNYVCLLPVRHLSDLAQEAAGTAG
jgi:hypothetical protein